MFQTKSFPPVLQGVFQSMTLPRCAGVSRKRKQKASAVKNESLDLLPVPFVST